MNQKQFNRFLERDGHRCYHCGTSGEDLVPNHRVNRGMGGSRLRDRPSNIVTLCSFINGQIEADALERSRAIEYGWKLASWEDPTKTAVFERSSGNWYILDDDHNRTLTEKRDDGN